MAPTHDQKWIINYQLKICRLLLTTIQMEIRLPSNNCNSWCWWTAVRKKLAFSKDSCALPNFDKNWLKRNDWPRLECFFFALYRDDQFEWRREEWEEKCETLSLEIETMTTFIMILSIISNELKSNGNEAFRPVAIPFQDFGSVKVLSSNCVFLLNEFKSFALQLWVVIS